MVADIISSRANGQIRVVMNEMIETVGGRTTEKTDNRITGSGIATTEEMTVASNMAGIRINSNDIAMMRDGAVELKHVHR